MYQQQLQQQIERTQQLCTNAMNLCSQVAQELQHIGQSVQTVTSNSGGYSQSYTQFGSQGSGQYGNGAVGNIMQADRAYDMQENTPSYRNYNTTTPSYSPQQSINYTSQSNPRAVQSVMSADRMASEQENTPSYRNYNTMTPGSYSQSSGSGSFQSGGNVQSVMQADQQYDQRESTPSNRNYNAGSFSSGGFSGSAVSSIMNADKVNTAY